MNMNDNSDVDLQKFLPWLTPATVMAIHQDILRVVVTSKTIPNDDEMVKEGLRMLKWVDHDLDEKDVQYNRYG